jgi:hypothetical protein
MKMAPGALVVLFHPSEAHVYNLLRLKRLVEDIVAVDNSPVVDVHLHERVRNAGIDILPNFNKGGVAGAYITPSTKLVTLFNWRHIGRGVHKNSSSPPWAAPA